MGTQPSPPKGGGALSPIFGPFLLWPNGWMHQDTTWYDCRPQPRGLYVRWRHSPSPKRGPPQFFGSCLLWLNGWMDQNATWHTPARRRRTITGTGQWLYARWFAPITNARLQCRIRVSVACTEYSLTQQRIHAYLHTTRHPDSCSRLATIGMGRKNWGGLLCPFWWVELGPHVIQCHLGQSLLPYQLASWSMKPFGHNTGVLQTTDDRQTTYRNNSRTLHCNGRLKTVKSP